MDLQQPSGFVIWLTGMKRAGKTTLATQLAQRLAVAGFPVQLLDEHGEAKFFIEGLGASKDDHAKVVKRFGYIARAVARAGGIAICSTLSPYRDARDALRKEVRRFVELFVDAPIETLQSRDGKEGLYRKALASEIQGVAGVDLPYEPPTHPELVLRTDHESVDACITRVYQTLVDGKFIAPADFVRLTGGLKPRRKPAKPARGAKAGKATKSKGAKVARAARQAPKKAAAHTAKRR
jgi:adenylyl-sulfate kinase